MADYDNTNRGGLFKNKRKTKENHPNLTGRINIRGTEYWLSGWTKKDRNGDAYISLSVGDECEQQPAKGKSVDPQAGFEQFDEDVPF